MHVICHDNFESLAPLAARWNALARDVPFRRWEWVTSWWKHYGLQSDGSLRRDRKLHVLTFWDDNEQLIGIAPWYRLRTKSGARVIRFLGDGEVCSDYVTILCTEGQEQPVATALAAWLTNCNEQSTAVSQPGLAAEADNAQTKQQATIHDYRWDRLEFTGVSAVDVAVKPLLDELHQLDNEVHFGRGMNAWRIQLPANWEDFLMMLSKAHRNRLRRADKTYLRTGQVTFRQVQSASEIPGFFDILIALHQSRWQRRGEPGCFASSQFQAFHREVAAQLFSADAASMSWLEMDGTPLVAEYRLRGGGVTYAYQSGIDPDRLQIKPGEIGNMLAIRAAIESGQKEYDFLRGDEPYKSYWRAKPQPLLNVRVIARHSSARLRHRVWLAGQSFKRVVKTSLQFATQSWSDSSTVSSKTSAS